MKKKSAWCPCGVALTNVFLYEPSHLPHHSVDLIRAYSTLESRESHVTLAPANSGVLYASQCVYLIGHAGLLTLACSLLHRGAQPQRFIIGKRPGKRQARNSSGFVFTVPVFRRRPQCRTRSGRKNRYAPDLMRSTVRPFRKENLDGAIFQRKLPQKNR
jgi:hypothetical protein